MTLADRKGWVSGVAGVRVWRTGKGWGMEDLQGLWYDGFERVVICGTVMVCGTGNWKR